MPRTRRRALRTHCSARDVDARLPRIWPVPSRARASRLGALAFLLVALGLLVVTVVHHRDGGDSRALTTATAAPTTRAPTTTTIAHSTTTTAAPTSTPPTSVATTTQPPPPPTPPSTAPPASSLLVTRVSGIGSAQQVITVATDGYGTSSATLTGFERNGNGWRRVFGPWPAYVGRNGVAPSGEKREGDGRTPSGVYGFDFMFGISDDPGTHFPYRRVTGTNIVWDDDSNSANYNRWIDTHTADAGVSPEPMYNAPSYDYGAVIAYNSARTPGLGERDLLARVARQLDGGLRRAADRPAAGVAALARPGAHTRHRHWNVFIGRAPARPVTHPGLDTCLACARLKASRMSPSGRWRDSPRRCTTTTRRGVAQRVRPTAARPHRARGQTRSRRATNARPASPEAEQ